MATDKRKARLEVTWDQLEALSWAVWFAAPASMTAYRRPLDDVHSILVEARRRMMLPRGVSGTPAESAEPDDRGQALPLPQPPPKS